MYNKYKKQFILNAWQRDSLAVLESFKNNSPPPPMTFNVQSPEFSLNREAISLARTN